MCFELLCFVWTLCGLCFVFFFFCAIKVFMNTFSRICFSIFVFGVFAVFPNYARALDAVASSDARSVGSPVEVHISDDGKVTVQGAEVIQIAGTTFYTRVTVLGSMIRFVIKTDNNTALSRRFGGDISSADIRVGDFLSIEGTLEATYNSLSVKAQTVKDWSIEKETNRFSGTVVSISPALDSFSLLTKDRGAVSVLISSSTSITKGVRTIGVAELAPKDKILDVDGVYSNIEKTLEAHNISVYQDPKVFAPRNFEGTLVQIGGVAPPTTLTLSVGGKEYTVSVPFATSILSKNKKPTVLSRFVTGDTIRVYGAIRQSNLSIIDIEVIRNLNL